MIPATTRAQAPAAVNGAAVTMAVGATGAVALPAPSPDALDGIDDAMSLLHKMTAKRGELAMKAGKVEIDSHKAVRTDALKREADALKKQREAEEEASHASHGFWASVAKVAGPVAQVAAIVGSSVLAVATFGAASPLAAAVIILSVGGAVVQQTHCFGDSSNLIGGLSMAAGSIVTLGGSALVNGAAQSVSLSVAERVTTGGALVASGTSAAATAVVMYETKNAQADALDAHTDAVKERHRIDREERLVQDVILTLKDVHKSNDHALESLQGAMQIRNQTLVMAASPTGRA
jgi:hypothetical protein